MTKSKSTIALVCFTAVVAICIVIGLLITKWPAPTDDATTPNNPVNVQINDTGLDNGNPTDYSTLAPGTEFYDEFWNGTVTIVGKMSEVNYNDLIANANGRLITNQDGMYIYVSRTDEEQKAVETVEETDPEDIPCEVIKAPTSDEDNAFYDSPSVNIENEKAGIPSDGSTVFPSQTITSVRYVIKQYLEDIDMPNVDTVTIIDNTLSYADAMHGYDCKVDGEDGVLSVRFNMKTCMWTLDYTADGSNDSHEREYNPLDFVAPSKRQQVADDLNSLLGYDRFQYGTQSAAKTDAKTDAAKPAEK